MESPDVSTPLADDRIDRRPLSFIIGAWVLFAILQASNWLLSPAISSRYPYPERLIASAAFNALVWIALTPPVLRFAAAVHRREGSRIRQALLVMAVGAAVSITAALLSGRVHALLLPAPATTAATVAPTETIPAGTTASIARLWMMLRWLAQELVTFLVVFLIGFASQAAVRHRMQEQLAVSLQARASTLQAEQAELRAHAAELQSQLSEARLAMLRARLNPHFLFNTLNAMSVLADSDPRGVRTMIALLSDLLRQALTDSNEQEIPLRQELHLIGRYLEILEIRYRDQLQTKVSAGPELLDALVPNLILQPLVENAMKHGIEPAGGHGHIDITVTREQEQLLLTVRNTGSPEHHTIAPGGQSTAGSGLGLELTRDRLLEHYGEAGGLVLHPLDGGGMIAEIAIPYHTRAETRAGVSDPDTRRVPHA